MAQTPAPNSARMAKSLRFSQGHPKPAFSEKVQRGDQRKFFKNRPRIRAYLKRLKALWRKRHYPSISMHLKCKDGKRFWRIRRHQKCPNGQVMAIIARSPKPAFSKKLQRGNQGKFFNNCSKSSPRLKNPYVVSRKWHYPLIRMRLKCKD